MKLFDKYNRRRGFTLLEVILTLVLAGILTVLFTPSFSVTLRESLSRMKDFHRSLFLMGVMGNITSYYLEQARLTGGDINLLTMQSAVGAQGTTQNNAFGDGYFVAYSGFIKFVGNVATPIVTGDPQDLLKISIRHSTTGQELTGLFARYTEP